MFGRKKKNNLLALYAEEIKEDVIDVFDWHKRRRRHQLILFLTYTVWTLSGLLLILIINLLIFLPGLKQIYWQALAGKGGLEKAAGLADAGRWQELNKVSAQAASDFGGSLSELRKIRLSPLGWLPFTSGKLNDGIYLLETGSLVSQSLADSSKIINDFYRLLPNQAAFDLSRLDKQQKKDLMKLLVDSQADLRRATNNLALAENDLSKIKNRQLIIDQGIDLDDLAAKIKNNQAQVAKAAKLAEILPILGGYPKPTNYLFILQNNDELRPTGGFIGTYGLAQTANGELVRLETNDIYHLDMPVKDRFKVEPPLELKKYLNSVNWYMRDANWSPDWQTSAQKIAWFYTQENKLMPAPDSLDNFDLIVGLTPKAITDLLELTGPIAVRGQVYTQANFVNLLQDTVEKDFTNFGLSSWNRKAVIGDITKAMQAKILANLDKDWSKLLEIISANLDAKNILIYTTNPTIYQSAKNNGWLGEIKNTSDDYLLVVDANMGALKSDSVVNKSIDYSLQETADGLVARVRVNYANRGTFTWKTTRYRSFTRVYVPKGSKLIKAAGYSGNQEDVVVGEELGKTYFGALVEIEPGKIGGLSFEYKLPYNLYASYKNGDYGLTVQKQPGARIGELNLDFQFLRSIKAYEPAVFYSYITGSRFRYKSDLQSDKNFSLKF